LNGKTGEVVRWVLSLILAGIVAYFTTTGSLDRRLVAVETKIEATGADVKELKSDVKSLLRAVR
jgi:hypothetical protein